MTRTPIRRWTSLVLAALVAFVALGATGCDSEETANGYRKEWKFERTADATIKPSAQSKFAKKAAAPAAPAAKP